MKHLEKYASWIFDFDGVLVDSNSLKTEAFRTILSRYPNQAVEQLVVYHKANGGLSRLKKLKYFFTDILQRPATEDKISELAENFAKILRVELLKCSFTPNATTLIDSLYRRGIPMFIISGANADEIRLFLAAKGYEGKFKLILGGEKTKSEHIANLLKDGILPSPTLFLGDSKNDHVAAARFGIDFVFAKRFSEFTQWEAYFTGKDVTIVTDLAAPFFSPLTIERRSAQNT